MSRAAASVPIRPARPGDLPRVLELLRRLDLPTAGVEEHFHRFVVASEDDVLQGVAGLEVHDRDGVLRSVAVDPGARGRGLGARLARRVIEDARAAGLGRLYLLTTTAEGWFPRHGFAVTSRDEVSDSARRSVEFREACPESATVMVLELG